MPQSILVVDDDPKVLQGIKICLEREGYNVLCADNGQAALEQAAMKRPDMVILDETLPDLNYEEVIIRLRSDAVVIGATPPPFLFMLSRETLKRVGNGSHLYSVVFSAPEKQSFPELILLKPFHPDEVKLFVNRLLNEPRNTP